ncbi:MAG: molecular chaperone HtpG, partial [Eggerthellaceae bacterium]|nr:molecular chaperone HtpG [Eggerthellaceae bacterium]
MRKFKAESQKLLDLVINSIYTNKEIFLRELISNASDAIDKLHFNSLTDKSIEVCKKDLVIRIDIDKDKRLLTVSDNGIGMDKEQLNINLGVIAHSDSMLFKEDNEEDQGKKIDIIGQFGVGFYSAFMIADNVTVVSKAYGSNEAYAWESDGVNGYDIKPAKRHAHGTDVILHIKPNEGDEDYDQYFTEFGIKSLIKKYSDYVRYPIQMMVEKNREVDRPEKPPEDYQPKYETYEELETINSMTPIWKKRKSQVKPEKYKEFYKSTFHDWTDPRDVISFHAEGALSYDVLLFIPGQRPYDFYSKDYKKGLQLYSANVKIMDKCEELLPDYFAFVKGIVDSQDLHLNISRETLQHNKELTAIARRIEKKIKQELEKMMKDKRDEYIDLWNDFGRNIKFGAYDDYGQYAQNVIDLLIFDSAKDNKRITFQEYLEGMQGYQPVKKDAEDKSDTYEDSKKGDGKQKYIYYAAGDDKERLLNLPIVQSVLKKGFNVLLCTEDIDEFALQSIHDYKGVEFKNVSNGDLGLETEEEKEKTKKLAKTNEEMLKA